MKKAHNFTALHRRVKSRVALRMATSTAVLLGLFLVAGCSEPSGIDSATNRIAQLLKDEPYPVASVSVREDSLGVQQIDGGQRFGWRLMGERERYSLGAQSGIAMEAFEFLKSEAMTLLAAFPEECDDDYRVAEVTVVSPTATLTTLLCGDVGRALLNGRELPKLEGGPTAANLQILWDEMDEFSTESLVQIIEIRDSFSGPGEEYSFVMAGDGEGDPGCVPSWRRLGTTPMAIQSFCSDFVSDSETFDVNAVTPQMLFDAIQAAKVTLDLPEAEMPDSVQVTSRDGQLFVDVYYGGEKLTLPLG